MNFDNPNISFYELRKRVMDKVEPVLFEATQRLNWWESDYNEQAHVEITLTIADVRALAVLKELCRCNNVSSARLTSEMERCKLPKGHSCHHTSETKEWPTVTRKEGAALEGRSQD